MACFLALAVRGGLSLHQDIRPKVPRRRPCTPAGTVFEITKGTRVLTNSPRAIHFLFLCLFLGPRLKGGVLGIRYFHVQGANL